MGFLGGRVPPGGCRIVRGFPDGDVWLPVWRALSVAADREGFPKRVSRCEGGAWYIIVTRDYDSKRLGNNSRAFEYDNGNLNRI